MRKLRIILLASGCAVLVLGGLCLGFYSYATTPVGPAGSEQVVWVKPGQGFSKTISELADVGLVRRPRAFWLLARLRGDDRRIRAGEYLLRGTMSPLGILNTLVRGAALLHKVIVPEGAAMVQIGSLLEAAGLCGQQAFVSAARDRRLLAAFGVEGDSFEGYLFPESYYFSKGVTAEHIVKTMVAQFRAVFGSAWRKRAKSQGHSIQDVVTLASIVEKETGRPEERPLIAAVFLNRLKLGMRLESDPTVIYGLESFDGNLRRKDLEAGTPYNTYRVSGLPPGPIANPGRAAIEAVLYPSDKPYLYFVSKNDGSHHFSRTLSEHNEMVRKYQSRKIR